MIETKDLRTVASFATACLASFGCRPSLQEQEHQPTVMVQVTIADPKVYRITDEGGQYDTIIFRNDSSQGGWAEPAIFSVSYSNVGGIEPLLKTGDTIRIEYPAQYEPGTTPDVIPAHVKMWPQR